MIEPKDKRTKEYKQWKETYGLGDLVNDITDVLGIAKCARCEERKKKWNNVSLFRKHKVARCLTDSQVIQYKDYKQNAVKGKWKQESLKLLIDLYAHAFAIQYHTKNFCVNCNGSGNTLQHIENQLDKLIEKQTDDS
jgi:viroplasmin and RNaseH domain-containing protein